MQSSNSKCTKYGFTAGNLVGELTALPRPSNWINGGPPRCPGKWNRRPFCLSLAAGLRRIKLLSTFSPDIDHRFSRYSFTAKTSRTFCDKRLRLTSRHTFGASLHYLVKYHGVKTGASALCWDDVSDYSTRPGHPCSRRRNEYQSVARRGGGGRGNIAPKF